MCPFIPTRPQENSPVTCQPRGSMLSKDHPCRIFGEVPNLIAVITVEGVVPCFVDWPIHRPIRYGHGAP